MARWHIAPTNADLWIARHAARRMSPSIEKPVKLLTFALDQRVLLSVAAMVWLLSRDNSNRRREEANHLLTVVAVTGLVPHLAKALFSQERPDRRFVKERHRRGIPQSGRACDAFPSGHAVHAGAIAAALSRFFPKQRPLIWTASGLLAATRIILFAHWTSDVAIGFGSGLALEQILWRLRQAPTALSRSKGTSALRRVARRKSKSRPARRGAVRFAA